MSGHHGLFGVNDYTHLLRGFLFGDCYFATFGVLAPAPVTLKDPAYLILGTANVPPASTEERISKHNRVENASSIVLRVLRAMLGRFAPRHSHSNTRRSAQLLQPLGRPRYYFTVNEAPN